MMPVMPQDFLRGPFVIADCCAHDPRRQFAKPCLAHRGLHGLGLLGLGALGKLWSALIYFR